MIRVDTRDFIKTLNNLSEYSYGFLDGINKNKTKFNIQLGELAVNSLNQYIDAKARANPSSLHHVYEWDAVGNSNARLFDIKYAATPYTIKFFGEFLPSRSVSEDSTEPFYDKARIMENQISIEVEPGESGVLAFEDEGKTVFTTKSIFIEYPGGPEVANSFGDAVSDFFEVYFTTTVLKQSGVLDDLARATEFVTGWTKASTRNSGIISGKKYLSIKGVVE